MYAVCEICQCSSLESGHGLGLKRRVEAAGFAVLRKGSESAVNVQ